MHLADASKRFWGGHAVVGGHLPIATGLALADHYRDDDRATICLMGDGATNIGYFHEALNMAGVWDLPVVWIIENNEYGMGTAVERASAVKELTKKAKAYDMPATEVDGTSVLTVQEAIKDAANHVRSGKGPVLLEIQTYRYRGHSMGDAERYREKDEVEQAQEERDPIANWANHLLEEEIATQERLDELAADAEQQVEEAVTFAKNSPYPEPEDLYRDVYA
jgi:pyruvate dehydrogenase E1 component alpha subunit